MRFGYMVSARHPDRWSNRVAEVQSVIPCVTCTQLLYTMWWWVIVHEGWGYDGVYCKSTSKTPVGSTGGIGAGVLLVSSALGCAW